MNRRSFPQEAIDFIKGAGYRVFMRDRADSYAVFASDAGVAYVQWEPMAGYTVATLHRANTQSGTGYQIARHADELTADMLGEAILTLVPHWHHRDTAPVKFSSIDEYRAQNSFAGAYSEV